MTRHWQIHQVSISQINLRDTASPFHHNGVITCSQTIEGSTDLFPEVNISSALFAPIIIRMFVAHRFAIQYHLGSMIALRLQQQRVHIRMTSDACSLSLNSLSPSDLQSFRCGITVECHILRFEGCWLITVLLEDTTEGCCNNALANIAACSCKHNGMQLFHI